MFALSFLNPMMLWALPLAALPIIIHLLNRRKYRTVPWAAMEFLLRAMKRNRRRLRMEHWLLLLLRTLAVLILVLLVARPEFSSSGVLGTTTHHVVVLDDSASMRARGDVSTLDARAKTRLRTLVDDWSTNRAGDLVTLLRTSQTSPDFVGERAGPELSRRAGSTIASLRPGEGGMQLAAALTQARQFSADVEGAGRTDYWLITDFRRVDWLTADGKADPEIRKVLAAMPEATETLHVIGLGSQESQNLAIAGVRCAERVSLAAVSTGIVVDVENRGLDRSSATEVVLEIDGETRTVRPVADLAPGERASVLFRHTFRDPGDHEVQASLPPKDRFPLDDTRVLVLESLARSRVLIVDGDPGEEAFDAESFYLATALEPGGETVSGIEAQVIEESHLADQDLAEFGMVWLCNVPAPEAEVIERLESFVAAGGGLVIYLGDQTDPESYNEAFHKSGAGLLTRPLGDLAGDPDRPVRGHLAAPEHDIVGELDVVFEALLGRAVLVKRWIELLPANDDASRVIFRVEGSKGAPLLIASTFQGGGDVAVLTVSADTHWSNMPITPLFLLLSQRLHASLVAAQDASQFNLEPSDTLQMQIDPGLFQADVVLRSLGEEGEQRTFTAQDATQDEPVVAGSESQNGSNEDPASSDPDSQVPTESPQLDLSIPMTELPELGTWEILLAGHGGGTERRLLARNVPAREGRLSKMKPAAMAEAYPSDVIDRIHFDLEGDVSGSTTASSGGGSAWRTLAFALLIGLLLEPLLAWRFGRRAN